MKEQDEIWIAAYSAAMIVLSVGKAVRGAMADPEGVDADARRLADRAVKTISERAGSKPKGKG